jgi:iodotyrosine deiodinase
MNEPTLIRYDYKKRTLAEMEQRAADAVIAMMRRRSVREFSQQPVPRILIENAIRVAGSAPSSANLQPWTFVAISSKSFKQKIRVAAEETLKQITKKFSPQYCERLASVGGTVDKSAVEEAPWLIAVFAKQPPAEHLHGARTYVPESVGIATGFLVAALHATGLATLVDRPEPRAFLNEMCGRPADERPYLMVMAGYPVEDCLVPVIARKPLEEIAVFVE